MRPYVRSTLIAAAFALAAAACQSPGSRDAADAAASAGEAVARPSKQYPIEDFVDSVGVGGSSFSADESRILFHSNRSGIWNAYTMPVTGGEWTPVTASTTDNVYAVSYFPADDWVLVARDEGGNELDHLYVIGTDGAEKDLTPGESLKADFLGFSGDGGSFFVISNERDPKYFDVYRYDSDDYARTLVYRNEAGWEPADVSPDGRWLALTQTHTTNDTDVH